MSKTQSYEFYSFLEFIPTPENPYQNNLFNLPADNNGMPLTYTLGKQPYIETSIGVQIFLRSSGLIL